MTTTKEKNIAKVYYLGNYDSRLPGGTVYAYWTSGEDYCFVFSDGTKYGIGSRFGNGYYTESVEIPGDLEGFKTIPIENVDTMVRGKINAEFGIDTLTERERKQIALEKEEAVTSDDAAEGDRYLTRTQAMLADDGFVFYNADQVIPDPESYFSEKGKEFVRWSEIPPGTLIRNLRFNYWNWGQVRYWKADCLIPWLQTRWGSKEEYEAEIKAEAERAKAEMEAKIAAEKELRSKYIKRVFHIGTDLRIPYSFVARCHANKEYLANAVKNIRAIVEYSVPVEEDLLTSGNWNERDAELQRLGFGYNSSPDFMPATAEYLIKCLQAGKILKKLD